MPILQATLTIELDGREMPDCSLTRRLQVDSATPFVLRLPEGSFTDNLPGAMALALLKAMLLRATDGPMQIEISNGVDPVMVPITINPGGFVLIFDASIPIGQAAAPQTVHFTKVDIPTTTIKGVSGGSIVVPP